MMSSDTHNTFEIEYFWTTYFGRDRIDLRFWLVLIYLSNHFGYENDQTTKDHQTYKTFKEYGIGN